MALNKAGLQSDLVKVFSSTYPTHIITAQLVATAIGKYWLGGSHPLNGIVIPAAAIPLLTLGFTKAWAPFQTSSAVCAKATADVVEKAMYTLILAGVPFGIGGVLVAQGAAGVNLLTAAFQNTPTGSTVAEKFAAGVEAITKTNKIFGTGTPPLVPPPTGSFV